MYFTKIIIYPVVVLSSSSHNKNPPLARGLARKYKTNPLWCEHIPKPRRFHSHLVNLYYGFCSFNSFISSHFLFFACFPSSRSSVLWDYYYTLPNFRGKKTVHITAKEKESRKAVILLGSCFFRETTLLSHHFTWHITWLPCLSPDNSKNSNSILYCIFQQTSHLTDIISNGKGMSKLIKKRQERKWELKLLFWWCRCANKSGLIHM